MGKKAKTPSGKKKAMTRKLPKSELPPPPKPLETEVGPTAQLSNCLRESSDSEEEISREGCSLFFFNFFLSSGGWSMTI
jgi:hypothetical protein